MSTHGKISSFNPEHESWTSYAKCLGYYFAAKDIVNETKKKAVLLALCGHTKTLWTCRSSIKHMFRVMDMDQVFWQEVVRKDHT